MRPYATICAALAVLQPVVYASTAVAAAAACSSTVSATYAAPSLASGYVARLVANGLKDPRSIMFDTEGALLVVESGTGITALTLSNNDGNCIYATKRQTVIADTALNHGIELSKDGTILYASSPEAVFSWDYAPKKQTNTSAPRTLVYNMTNSDHTTRTLLLSKFVPGMLMVTRGSTSNIDPLAEVLSTGHSQVKAFNIKNVVKPLEFESNGRLLGWGLRNDVGIAEHPIEGGIYTVENSVDQMTRNGVDIHNTNPSEELNFLGYLNGTQSNNQGRNFGYPQCYTAWDTSSIPGFKGKVGQQFAIGKIGPNNTDEMCSNAHKQKARLGFHPHMAPLDILFNTAGDVGWVTFHGSWDSTVPVGYKLGMVKFANGEPVEPATSNTALIDIMTNANTSNCYHTTCFRPVGLAWDKKGTLFMSSDATGEIYAITRQDGKPVNSPAGPSDMKVAVNTTSSTGSRAAGTTRVPWLEALVGVVAFLCLQM